MTGVEMPKTLAPGDRVAVVGGGPAGSFFALNLLRFARRLAIPLSVSIFERKDFNLRGPAGCNRCAGILSARTMQGLIELGLQIPENLVLARLTLEGFDYRRPRTEFMAQDELGLPTPLTPAQRGQVHVYVGSQAGLLFGALIPKGEHYLNLSLLGRHFEGDPIKTFLARADCAWLEEAKATGLCGCRPQIAIARAHHPFGDRFVAVGDAAVTRLYKNGIGSAFVTARQAAWTALHVGISQAAFSRCYAPLCRSIAFDNRVGKLLFAPWDGRRSRLHQLWERWWVRVLLAEARLPVDGRPGHRAVWSMLTGDDSYIHIARNALHPRIIGELIAAMLPERKPLQTHTMQAAE